MSNDMVWEPTASAQDQDTWRLLREQALAGLNWRVLPSTSAEAPGLLASVAHHLGAHHAPALFHVPHALRKAVSAPMALKQRAAHKAVTTAEETLTRVHEHRNRANDERAPHGPGRPPKSAASLEPVQHEVDAARHEHQRLSAQREQVSQRIRAIGHAYHCVDLERGVRRHGQRIAGDIQSHIDTIRPIAQQEGRSETCLARRDKAARVVPNMQATVAFVSGSVGQQVKQLEWAPPQSFAMPAYRMPSYDLDRVASTRTVTAGAPLCVFHGFLPPSPWECCHVIHGNVATQSRGCLPLSPRECCHPVQRMSATLRA
ncbi:MAG: hypothetical protein FJZ47_14080 [Candidatus Tectomicrobia bacterium]|uniref:Uncharacterized protein n=1 Tax=Tectimicrobiota bacterium TaxID=2528274 RepID=A0A937W374_UNCTE|nr:hypothetical protein [Candidatus Tectomicrobia bacterium]